MAVDAVLSGDRIVMRAPRIDDAEALFAEVASDPEVTRYLTWTPHPDVDETRRVITELFNVGEHRTWLIELRETGGVVGVCGLRRRESHSVELGYCLARRWWGHGLMPEAVGMLLEHLQRDPGLYRVSATCHVDNTRSARVLERSGLSFEGRLARYVILPNISAEPQDVLLFAKAVR